MSISPIRPKGLPLNAMRAFEAAARLGSFSKAASELCVTPGAIAQQVKTLEKWAGADLFERRSQGVKLTVLGRAIRADFEDAFNRLMDAAQSLRADASHYISIAALPSVAQLWLSPRLPAIRADLPDITISVTAMERPPNLRRELYDLTIFYEESEATTNLVFDLGNDVVFPVCAPIVAKRLKHPEDLANETFLHDGTWSSDWERWIASAFPNDYFDTSGPVFSLFSLALEEAKNGAGVLIGHEALVQPLLSSGALIAPFKPRLSMSQSLLITVAKPLKSNTAIQRLIQSLKMMHVCRT